MTLIIHATIAPSGQLSLAFTAGILLALGVVYLVKEMTK